MKVKDLIAVLNGFNPEMEVLVHEHQFPNDSFTRPYPIVEETVISGGHWTLKKWRPAAEKTMGECVIL